MRSRKYAAWSVVALLTLSAAYVFLTWELKTDTGLTQTFFRGVGADRTRLVERRTPNVDLGILEEDTRLPRRSFSVRWSGVWHVPDGGLYDIYLDGGDRVILTVDGRIIQEHSSANGAGNPRTVSLGPGFHAIEVDYQQSAGPVTLDVKWAPFGATPRPLNPDRLFPGMPRHPQLRAGLEKAGRVLPLLGFGTLAVLLCAGLRGLSKRAADLLARRWAASTTFAPGRVVAIGLVVLVVIYGAILRFDALTLRFGTVERPAWLHALQQSRGPTSVIRPAALTWTPVTPVNGRLYISDPYTYLKYAREMRSFYAAHRREPVFPFATKIFLWLLDQQDIAVSFASAFFSVLAVIATFLLGSYAFSYGVGLAAATAMAIEHEVIFWGVDGGRDDAFTCAVVLCAYVMLRYLRSASRGNAILMGAVAGIACLVRITSLSFTLPAFAWLLFTTRRPWRERLNGVGLGVLTMTTIVAPFVINCWLVFGDPLYSINVHADVYRATERQAVQPGQSAATYVEAKAYSRPMRTLDTVVMGLTSYPFQNKWRGFDPWSPTLGKWLSWACLLGLVLFIGSGPGRLVLMVLAASLIPYAVTWKLIADWRFTEHAYPLFLIASCFAIGRVVAWTAPSRIAGLLTYHRPGLKRVACWALIPCGVGIGVWTVTRVLPVLTVREALLAGEAVTITAGGRDGSFFGEGWSEPVDMSVPVRVSQGPYSVVWVPLPRVQDYDLILRVDPFPRPLGNGTDGLPVVRVFVNGHALSRLDLHWTLGRVGSYEVRLPRSVVKAGFNRLTLAAEVSPSGATVGTPPARAATPGAGFRLWYVRVRPPVQMAGARMRWALVLSSPAASRDRSPSNEHHASSLLRLVRKGRTPGRFPRAVGLRRDRRR